MISIGAVFHGPELKDSKIDLAILAASKIIKSHRGALDSIKTPWVNAVFVVSGSMADVDFECLEFGDYSIENKGVVVKIPVPRKIRERDNLNELVTDSLRGANAMAFEFFRLKGEEFPLREAEALVTKVADGFRSE